MLIFRSQALISWTGFDNKLAIDWLDLVWEIILSPFRKVMMSSLTQKYSINREGLEESVGPANRNWPRKPGRWILCLRDQWTPRGFSSFLLDSILIYWILRIHWIHCNPWWVLGWCRTGCSSGSPPQVVAGQWPLPRSTSSLWPVNPASLMPLLQTSKSGEMR